MTIEDVTPTPPALLPAGLLLPTEETPEPAEDIPLELLLARRAQEPTLRPRVFPGL